jgi:predicted PolB exonuclease-like 3'-5' exonuclease
MKKSRTLYYDIETSLLIPFAFGMGKQVVRHNQLMKGYFSRTHIMTISYKWADQKKVTTLTWGTTEAHERKMIEDFDKEVQKADQVIGKNNRRFDDKLINTSRMWFDLPGHPEWIRYNDDLESQMRKYFRLPSQSLDYISEQLGLGGKDKMGFDDWRDLAQYRMLQLAPRDKMLIRVLTGDPTSVIAKKGQAALKKMSIYNKKDVTDTQAVWDYCVKHFEPRLNKNTQMGVSGHCKSCGSSKISRNGTRVAGKTKYQHFYCNEHGGYAGRASINKHGKIGGIG